MHDFMERKRQMAQDVWRQQGLKNAAHNAMLAHPEGSEMRRRLARAKARLERERRGVVRELSALGRSGMDGAAAAIALSDAL